MAADNGMITVTFIVYGGLFPREVTSHLPWWLYDSTIARYAPEGAYAFTRSDAPGTAYIDGEALSVEDLKAMGKPTLARDAIGDGALYAVRLRGTGVWCPFFRDDRVVKTSR